MLLSAAALLAAPLVARAADVTSRWASASSGTWNVNANWLNTPATGGFPNNGNAGVATYAAVIDQPGGPYTVTLDAPVTLESLSLNSAGDTLAHAGSGALSAPVGGVNVQAGTYLLSGGTISNTTINVTGGTFAAGSPGGRIENVTINGAVNLPSNSSRLAVGSPSTFNGAVNVSGANAIIGFNGTQTLSPTTYNIEGSSAYLSTEGAGTLTIPAGATVRGGNASPGGIWYGFFSGGGGNTIVNQGTIRADVTGGTFNLVPSGPITLTSSGTLAATNGATLTIGAASWSNATGTLLVNNGTANLGGAFTSPGTIVRTGGAINVTGVWDNTGQHYTLTPATGDVTLFGGTVRGGSLTFSGAALGFSNHAGNRFEGVTVNGSLNLSNSSARLGIGSASTLNGVVNVSGSSAVLGFNGTQTISPTTYNIDGPSAYLSTEGAGTLTIPAGATVRGGHASPGGIWYGFFSGGGGNTIVNQGTIRSDVIGGTFSLIPNGPITFINHGTLAVTSGATLVLGAASWSNATGTFVVNNGTVALGGTFTSPGAISRTGGAINVTGNWLNTGNTYTFTPATGDFNLAGGTVAGGTLTFAGAAMNFANHSGNRFDGVTVNGSLNLATSGARLAVLGASTFNGAVNISGDSAALGFAGTQTISPATYSITGSSAYLSTEGSGTLTIPPGATVRGGHVTSPGGIWYGQFFGGGANTVVNQGTIRGDVSGGTLTVFPTAAAGHSFINAGTLAATNGGRLRVHALTGNLGNANASGAGSAVRLDGTYTINQPLSADNGGVLYFDGAWTKSATIDVGGGVVFDYDPPNPSPLPTLVAQVLQGFNGGAWNGGGFNSTRAAATPGTGVGYAEASDAFGGGSGVFAGQAVDVTAVLLRWTRLGDADINGLVNLADFNRLAANFGGSNKAWSQGDFDYNGIVNLNDFNRLAANFGLSAAGPSVTPEDWSNLAAAVPEPGALVSLVCGLAILLPRRRRCCARV